ncbi:NAD(P)-binding protein [Polychaeton citri CBS 116435]|uniref:Short-chain dehydrogenase/reductase 3 n=1 Tax=Polychaeton citri CBS 116435 TaxID=1314669 RepID=A0A9P4Q1Q0_9PEZI|nr:NAD(P)-binding protein [Polychaeton citri CBS 116435]
MFTSVLLIAVEWLFACGVMFCVHCFLSELAQNNFRFNAERHRYDWPNEIAVVTGAAGGFGRLITRGLADEGITVIALDLRDSLPADLQSHRKVFYYKCDITSPEAVRTVANTVRADHGNPSILVNNAGIAFESSILNITPERLRQIFEVNTLSHYYTVDAFVPSMITQRKGHIVTMASMASFVSRPGMVHYCMTKSALLAFHEGLAAELRSNERGFAAPEIKLTCVYPTWAMTPMAEPFRAQVQASGMAFIEPQSVANAVVNQVLSGRGRQIILGGGVGWIASIRAWPSWLSGGLALVEELMAR